MDLSTADSTPGRIPTPTSVPLIDVQRQYRLLAAEIQDALGRVCESGRFVLGPDVQSLEESLASYCQVPHAIGCASGSDALLLALMAYDVGPGDEVIVPSYTFFATAAAVVRLGAKPIFADIDSMTFNLDPQAVANALTPATKAIIPVHLYGQCAEMEPICRLAKRQGIPVIEDAAQAIGAEYRGRRTGGLADVACFSFYPTKNLGGFGDGGLLTTSDAALAEKLRLLRGHGMHPRYHHRLLGINSRLDSLQAAVLNVKLPHLDRWTALRQAHARRYAEWFAAAGLSTWLTLPTSLPDRRHVWNQYVIRVGDGQREALREHLTKQKIGTEIYYPISLDQQPCFEYLQTKPGSLPQTQRAAAETLALPIFPEMTAAEQELVVREIEAFHAGLSPARPSTLAGPKFLKRNEARSNQRIEKSS